MMEMTAVKTCATTACAYNNDGCTAFAVTIGGAEGAASCTTFLTIDARGGLADVTGKVGACQRLECAHNTDLMCTASAVDIADNANCLSYDIR